MVRAFHVILPVPVRSALVAVVAVLGVWSCGRTIEEEEPRELVEHRIEPCRQWCSAMLSPECGFRPEEQYERTIEGCVDDCADIEGGWEWALQADGTDACAEEWFAAADCMDALSCDEQSAFFNRIGTADEYPCKAEVDAKSDCFYSTPSLERTSD